MSAPVPPSSSVRRRGAALAVALATAGPAFGQSEPRVTGFVSLTAEADSNLRLEDDPAPAVGLTGRAGATWSGLGPRGGPELTASFAARAFGGGGAEDEDTTSDLESLAPDLNFGWSHAAARSRYSLGLFARITPTAFVELDETSLALRNRDALQTSFGASGTAGFDLGTRDAASVAASLSRTDYIDAGPASGLNPSTRASLGLGWSRELTERLSGSLDADLSGYVAENAADTRSLTLAARAGGGWQATSRLAFSGGVGPSVTWIEEAGSDSLDPGVSARLSVDWAPTSRDAAAFGFDQSVRPDVDGNVVNAARATASWRRQLNSRVEAGLSASAGLDLPLDGGGTGERIYATASPTLSYALSPAASLSLGYRLRYEDAETGDPATSHNVFLTLTRRFGL